MSQTTTPFREPVITASSQAKASGEKITHSALIIDPESKTRRLIGSSLRSVGIDATYASNSTEMWEKLAKRPDVVILDTCLKDANGLELLRQLRRRSNIPVVIHSSRSNEADRILGIEMGADDFMPKTCSMRELAARTRRLIKRTENSPICYYERRLIRFGKWSLDNEAQELGDDKGRKKLLSRYPFEMLNAFLARPFEPLSRNFLSEILQRTYTPLDRVIDVHVSNLRRLLGKQADGSNFIKAWRSHGYIFIAKVEGGTFSPPREAFGTRNKTPS